MSAALTCTEDRVWTTFQPKTVTRATLSHVPTKNSSSYPASHRWLEAVGPRLFELAGLDRGWDGYVSQPINTSTISFALGILFQIMKPGVPAPSIVPLAYGGLQVEWHRKGWDIEMEVSRPNEVHVWAYEIATQIEHHFDVSANVARLLTVIQNISD